MNQSVHPETMKIRLERLVPMLCYEHGPPLRQPCPHGGACDSRII